MPRNTKPYEIQLEPHLADDVLNMPVPGGDADTPDPPARTIRERVRRAIQSVAEANSYLRTSPLARLTADTLMRQLKKRGAAALQVRPDGVVVLKISYEEDPNITIPTVQKAPRRTDIPKLNILRERAEAIGLDISDLGRARKAIYERLLQAEHSVGIHLDPLPEPEPEPVHLPLPEPEDLDIGDLLS